MKLENERIRKIAKQKQIPFWKICEVMEISEPTFSRLMRRPLPEKTEKKILHIIASLAAEAATEEADE